MLRWLLLPLGLAVALAAGWLLLAPSEPPPVASGAASPARSTPEATRPRPKAPGPGKPMGSIDDASRRELESVLEREGVAP